MKTHRFSSPAAWFALLALGVTVTLGSGCFAVVVGAAAGAGTVAWVRGELDANLGHPYDAVSQAANSAVQQEGFVKVSESKDAFTDEIIARTADDKRVEIKVSRRADDLTRVEIRIGTFGNEAMSRAILDRITKNL